MAKEKPVKYYVVVEVRRPNTRAKRPTAWKESDITLGKNTRRVHQMPYLMTAVEKLITDGFEVRLTLEHDD